MKMTLFCSQDIESDKLSDHLAVLADSLNKAKKLIYPPVRKQFKLGENLNGLMETVSKEHRRLLARKSIIEKRKEEHERQMLEMVFLNLLKEREEESKRLKLQRITEEAEQKRLAEEYIRREEQRIRREIEERELQEAQALLLEAQKGAKKKGKKPLLEGEKVTKQTLIELALSEQLKERQEMEKKLQKLAKTMDYMERAKREEEASLIEQAFQQSLVQEKIIHEREQLKEIELSRQHHAGDLQEKNRLARMLDNKVCVYAKCFPLKSLIFLRKKEEAERRAKLDAIAERQRQREREAEEKERLRREALLRRPTEPLHRPTDPVSVPHPSEPVPVPAAAAAAAAATPAATPAPGPGKYVPRFLRERNDVPKAAPPETDRWGRQDNRPPPSGDKWRGDERRSSFGAARTSSSSSSWSSSRPRGAP
ncbi:hypothetical protein GW17_00025233 [Ensete ventricosum]|nr:hypothetical protein GW17_00025233 [Ensete ventricosum]